MANRLADWVFFPIVGIQVKTDPNTACDLLFERATILSLEDVRHFVGNMPFAKDRHELDETLLIAETVPFVDEKYGAHSILAVRAIGQTDELRNESALQRYREIVGVLSVVLMVRTEFKVVCSSIEHRLILNQQSTLHVSKDLGLAGFGFGVASRSHLTRYPEPPLQLTREELLSMMMDGCLGHLAKAVVLPKSKVDLALKRTMSHSVTVLAEAIHAASPETQVVNAITSLEVLLSIGRSNFDLLKKRCRVLVGDHFYKILHADSIISKRNRIVHVGDLGNRGIARDAIVFAIGAHLAYAVASHSVRSKKELLRSLDWPTERARVLARFKGAQVTSAEIEPADVLGDYQLYKIVSYFLPPRKLDGSLEDARLNFCKAIGVLQRVRHLSRKRAFEALSRALTLSPCPFSSYQSFVRYFKSAPSIDESVVERLTANLRRRWQFR